MLELVVVIVVIVSLAAASYTRLAAMTESVERADFVRTLNRMQAQLTLKIADWYVEGKVISQDWVEMTNPMSLLEVLPENYAGEMLSTDLGHCPLATWCYLTDKNWLVYRVKYTSELINSYTQQDILVLRATVDFAHSGDKSGLATALTLTPEFNFEWQNEKFD